MEVAPGIHRIEAPLGSRIIAVYLFIGRQAALLIDTGIDATVTSTIRPYLAALDMPCQQLRYILSTHSDFDHIGGNGAARASAPHAIFLAHKLDAPMVGDLDRLVEDRYGEFRAEGFDDPPEATAYIRANTVAATIDIGLSGGEQIDLGDGWLVEVLHTPGHTRGSISVWDPRSRTAVIGDAALATGVVTASGAPAFPPTYRYVDSYIATIARLRSLDAAQLCTSHYAPLVGPAVADFLSASLGFVDRLEAALRNELHRAPDTALELVHRLAPTMGDWPPAAAQALIFPVYGHLERLAAARRVQPVGGGDSKPTVWRCVP